MKANELRIGNWVFGGAREYKVDANMIYDVQFLNANFEPIPLTEEWLLKFGAIKKPELDGLYNLHGLGIFDGATYEIYISEKGDFITDIQYVHQLQNLYFALTGQELELK